MNVQHSAEVEEKTREYDDRVVFEDGVEIVLDGKIKQANRWQKYGNDRLYPRFAEEGYVDLKEGEASDFNFESAEQANHGVGDYSLRLHESGKIALLAHPREGLYREGEEAEPVVHALIPCEVLKE